MTWQLETVHVNPEFQPECRNRTPPNCWKKQRPFHFRLSVSHSLFTGTFTTNVRPLPLFQFTGLDATNSTLCGSRSLDSFSFVFSGKQSMCFLISHSTNPASLAIRTKSSSQRAPASQAAQRSGLARAAGLNLRVITASARKSLPPGRRIRNAS